MAKRDGDQYSTPQDKPKQPGGDPQLPGDERERNIRSGASEDDQLEKLQPDNEEDKAPNKIGNPPNTRVDDGD